MFGIRFVEVIAMLPGNMKKNNKNKKERKQARKKAGHINTTHGHIT